MRVICLHDKAPIADVLRRETALHLYGLGDLDDFFWPYTTWYGLEDGGKPRQVCLLYSGADPPTLLALAAEPLDEMRALLRSILHLLPRRLWAHLSGDLVELFRAAYRVASHGPHYKMALARPERLAAVDTSAVEPVSAADLPALQRLYAASYPGNWFDPRMLETGYYYGVRDGAELLSVAGIHVYSPIYKVAALGNITTRPEARGRGLATAATAALCRALLPAVEHIGLNVKAGNTAAIAAYERLGFERVATYDECALEWAAS